ncbi:MAG: hypothetical protein PHR47_03060 [Candidatus Pacebacteria bacterium]|nr:hypothetical protein [Candidatus Paceibacterota bacterium]
MSRRFILRSFSEGGSFSKRELVLRNSKSKRGLVLRNSKSEGGSFSEGGLTNKRTAYNLICSSLFWRIIMDVKIATFKNEQIPENSLLGMLDSRNKKWVWIKNISKESAEIIEAMYANYLYNDSIKWAIAIHENQGTTNESITIIVCIKEKIPIL